MGCNALCGTGERERKVLCYGKSENGSVEIKDDSSCEKLAKPATTEECQAEKSCQVYDWVMTPWSKCDDPQDTACGESLKNINYFQ